MRALRSIMLLSALTACASEYAIDNRVEHWRSFLKENLPIGSPGERAFPALQDAGLNPRKGSYIRIMNDGRRESPCRDHKMAVTGTEISAVRGLWSSYDIQLIVCLADDGRIEKHDVSAWNRGF